MAACLIGSCSIRGKNVVFRPTSRVGQRVALQPHLLDVGLYFLVIFKHSQGVKYEDMAYLQDKNVWWNIKYTF